MDAIALLVGTMKYDEMRYNFLYPPAGAEDRSSLDVTRIQRIEMANLEVNLPMHGL
jgi:hypothetical protein